MLLFALQETGFSSPYEIDIYTIRARELLREAVEWYNVGDYLKAIETCKKAIHLKPDYGKIYYWLGRCYYKYGEFQKAVEALTQAQYYGFNNRVVRNLIAILNGLISGKRVSQETVDYHYSKTIKGNVWTDARFIEPTDVAVGPGDVLFVVSYGTGYVLKFNMEGRYIGKLGRRGKGGYKRPYGIALTEEAIFVSDWEGDQILKYSLEGKLLKKWGGPGSKPGKFHGPEGITVDSKGYVYVVDTGNCRVQRFDQNGNLTLVFGKYGRGDSQFLLPTGIAVDSDGRIFVSDAAAGKIKIYDESGNFLETIEHPFLNTPRQIKIYQNFLYIADAASGLCIYNVKTKEWFFINKWGRKGKFKAVFSIAINSHGMLYAADHKRSTVDVFLPVPPERFRIFAFVERTDLTQYPLVAHYVSLVSPDDRPIENMTADNFRVREQGVPIAPLEIYPTKNLREKLYLVLVVSRTVEASKYIDDFRDFLRNLFMKFEGKLNLRVEAYQDITIAVYPRDRDFGVQFDKAYRVLGQVPYKGSGNPFPALQKAIYSLIGQPGRRAILMLAEPFEIKAYQQREWNRIINYAKANFIHIYTVCPGSSNSLKALSFGTRGKFFNLYTTVPGKLYRMLWETPVWEYVVVYEAPYFKRSKGVWRDVLVSFRLGQLKGEDLVGYFTP